MTPSMLQSLEQSFITLPVGMGFVMLVLWGIYLLCASIGRTFVAAEHARETAAQHAKEETEKNHVFDEADETLTLVIAAAVDRLLEGKSFRIVSIKPLSHSSWVEQGRMEIFRSRNTL